VEIVVTNLKYPNISKYRAVSNTGVSMFNPFFPIRIIQTIIWGSCWCVLQSKSVILALVIVCKGNGISRGGYSPDPLRLDKPMIKPTTDYCTETLVRSCTMLHMNTAQHGSKIMIPYDSNLHPCRKPYSLVPIQDPNHKTPAE
jgi:hypothetical protein